MRREADCIHLKSPSHAWRLSAPLGGLVNEKLQNAGSSPTLRTFSALETDGIDHCPAGPPP